MVLKRTRQAKGSALFRNQRESSILLFLVLDLTFISTSISIKKSRLSIPSLVKGFVPAATSSHSPGPSVMITAANSHDGNTINADVDFKMGGLENLDEDGKEVADKVYPKYAEIRAEAQGKKGSQVRISEYLCTMVDSNFYRL